MSGTISDHLHKVFALAPEHWALQFADRKFSWATFGALADDLAPLLARVGARPDETLALLARNSPAAVGAFLAVVANGVKPSLVSALRRPAATAETLEELNFACLVGDTMDLSEPVMEAARRAGSGVIEICELDGGFTASLRELPKARDGRRKLPASTAFEIQTSGTTGKPKWISIPESMLSAALGDGVRSAKGTREGAALTPKTSPGFVFGPLAHTSGVMGVLMAAFEARPIVLFEKFTVAELEARIREHRPKFLPLMPTPLKMVLDSDVSNDLFAGVLAIRTGSAPLPLAQHRAFEERFGVPILTNYGATEFMGTVASWSLDLYRQFQHKRGSVGRADRGCTLRIVDQITGEEVAADIPGILEARVGRVDQGKSWIRTNDLARIDEDGFLYILGRADDAIIRGGFKILASKIGDTLALHPAVADVIVLGVPDARLGQSPEALVVPKSTLTGSELLAFARERLTGYEVPARVVFVESLPKTLSQKTDRVAAMRLLTSARQDLGPEG